MDEKFQEECLSAHNEFRRKHAAPPLVLDPQISRVAQKWANHIANRNKMEHSSGSGFGENIYASMGKEVTGRAPVESWYSEIKDYRFADARFSSGTGHFTQVVWRSTTKIGVARATNSSGWTYVVANYSPPGNFVGQFDENVLPPGDYGGPESTKPAAPKSNSSTPISSSGNKMTSSRNKSYTPEDDIEKDIREIEIKYGHEDPDSLCKRLHSKLSSNHGQYTWLVTVAQGSTYGFNVGVLRGYVHFDIPNGGNKDVAIFYLKNPSNDSELIVDSKEFKDRVRNAFTKAQKERESGTVKEVLDRAKEIFPDIGGYQQYVLKNRNLTVSSEAGGLSYFEDYIGDYFVLLIKAVV